MKITYGSYKIDGVKKNCVKLITRFPAFWSTLMSWFTEQTVIEREDHVLVVTKAD